MKENKPYFKIYSNKNKRAKSRGANMKNTPLWFNYKVEELEDLNSLKKYLNVGGVPLHLENQKEGFIKNIKKTKPTQIKYLLEDMDEEVRRLKNAVLYVGFCNRELKKVLKNEEIELETKMQRLEKVLKFSNSENENQKKISKTSSPINNQNYMISNSVEPFTNNQANNIAQDNKKNMKEDDDNTGDQNNYLLTQLQRQLFDLNSKLKYLKSGIQSLKKQETFEKLEEMKKQLNQYKKQKKEKMLELHNLEEKYIEKKIGEERIYDLKKK